MARKAALDASDIEAKLRALRRIGVPYTDADISSAKEGLANKMSAMR